MMQAMHKFKKLIFVVGLTLHASAFATETFTKGWTLFTFNGHYDKFLFYIEPQLRLVNRTDLFEQFLFNIGGGKEFFPHIQFWLGNTVTNFGLNNELVTDVIKGVESEYRPWQQIIVTDNNIFGNFLFRNRLEERHANNKEQWSIRFRERTYWTIPLTHYQDIVISDEFFINVKKAHWITTKKFDQNRTYLGIQQRVTKNFSFSVSYMNQYINQRNIPEDNNVFILNFFYNMPFD